MIVFVNSSVLFDHKPARYGGNSMLYKKEEQGLFARSLASSGQVSMPTSNFNQT